MAFYAIYLCVIAFHAQVRSGAKWPDSPDVTEAQELISCIGVSGWSEECYRRAVKAVAWGRRAKIKVLKTGMPYSRVVLSAAVKPESALRRVTGVGIET